MCYDLASTRREPIRLVVVSEPDRRGIIDEWWRPYERPVSQWIAAQVAALAAAKKKNQKSL